MRHARRTSAPPTRSRAIAALVALLLTSGIGVTAASAVPESIPQDEVAGLQSGAAEVVVPGTEVPTEGVPGEGAAGEESTDAPFSVEVLEPAEDGEVESSEVAELPEADVPEVAARGVGTQAVETPGLEAQSLEVQAIALAAVGPNPAVRPTPGSNETVLMITAGGLRNSGGVVTGLAGASFHAQAGTAATNPTPTNPAAAGTKYTCQYVTDSNGVCYIVVPNRTGSSSGNANGYWVTQDSAPTGWTSLTALGTGTYDSAKTVTPYRFFVGPVSGTANTTDAPKDASTAGNR